MAIRDGFIIPNANTYAPDFQTSQPDQGDFVILGNSRYGVITGCKVILSGNNVSIGTGPNILVVNGSIYNIGTSLSSSIASTGINPRFDLVVYDTSSSPAFNVVTGTASSNPVFPDVTSTMTVLAAVFSPSTSTGNSPHIIDKRHFLQTSLSGYNTDTLISNYTNTSATYAKVKIDGNGRIDWGNGTDAPDAAIYRTSTNTVQIDKNLQTDTLSVTTGGTIAGKNIVTNDTISWGSSFPTVGNVTGDIFVDTDDGTISVYKNSSWVSVDTTVPSGTVIMSMTGANMDGWLPLSGGNYLVSAAGNLPTLFPQWVSGNNIYLPDMSGLLPIGSGSGNPVVNNTTPSGSTVSKIDNKGTVRYTLSKTNIPAHTHQEGISSVLTTNTSMAGSHTHVTTITGGDHTHDLVGGSHTHFTSNESYPIVNSPSGGAGTGSIPLGALDAPNNIWVKSAPGNRTSIPDPPVTIQTASHSHAASVEASGTHSHTISANQSYGQANPDPITITPPTFALLFYIKK